MELITLSEKNIDKEHICCALASSDCQVESKKEWLKEQFAYGLQFVKMNVRGKCFIEYIPIEHAWISLKGYDLMYINCLWVAGRYQGQGYAQILLKHCIQESQRQGKKGLVILSSEKKKPYIMDQKFLIKQGFYTADHWQDYELMFLPFFKDAQEPRLCIPKMEKEGLVLYYTHQCPFNIKYVNLLKKYCQDNHIPMQFIHIQTREQAIQTPTPLTTYSLFYQRQFITREVLTIKKFEEIRRNL